jgi:hypothetical protein
MIQLTLYESTSQFISGIPEYIEFEADVAANIFYTLDGSTPGYDSLIAIGRVYLPTTEAGISLRAIAISANDSSDVLSKEYFSDQTNLDAPRRVSIPGVSILPAGSTSVNSISLNESGGEAQSSSIYFDDLDIKASRTSRQGIMIKDGKTSIDFVNLAKEQVYSDSFSSSEVNENIFFDPKAKLILIDGTDQDNLNNQTVRLINRTYNSFDPTSSFYTERLGQKEPLITGNYLRSFYNPKTGEYISYYWESLESRWIISKQKLNTPTIKKNPSYSSAGKFVFQWVEDRGSSTPAAMISSFYSASKKGS